MMSTIVFENEISVSICAHIPPKTAEPSMEFGNASDVSVSSHFADTA